MKLYKQLPKPAKKPIEGQITAHHKNMDFWTPNAGGDGKIAASLSHPEIVYATSHGIYLKGYEPSGVDKTGREVVKYQEWWIAYA